MFFNWLMTNYKLVILCLVLAILLALCLIILIKVCKKDIKVILDLFTKLPSFINEAEDKGFVSGQKKLSYVLQLCLNYLIVITGCSAKKAVSQYGDLLTHYIEDILSTPQKKGSDANEK